RRIVTEILLMKIIVAANVCRPEFESVPPRPRWDESGKALATFEMPFADKTGVISRIAKYFCNGHLIGGQRHIIHGDSDGVRILARQQRPARRGAHSAIGNRAGELDALSRQAVQ